MTRIKCVVFLVVLTFQWTLTRGDTDVSCVFMERCIFPCSYEVGADVVIHWHQLSAGNLFVHSFYHNQDQLELQNQRFRGRTLLFKDQISRGNASLQLTGMKVQDQGRYKCYTSTITGNKESFIQVKMHAPVHEVNIQQVENKIICSSEGIYPEPELTWSTSPPSSITSSNTTVQQTEQQLYNISSSLILSDTDINLNYSCTISTHRNSKTATFSKPRNQEKSGNNEVIGGVIAAILIIAAVGLVVYIKSKKRDEDAHCRETATSNEPQFLCPKMTPIKSLITL